MEEDDVVATPKARAVRVGRAGIPYLRSVITVEGEPERVHHTRLIPKQAHLRPGQGDSSRYRLVYKVFSMERLTSVNSTRKSWPEGTHERATDHFDRLQSLSQGRFIPE